jgi:transposase
MRVTLSKINIAETLDNARQLLAADKQISPALRAMFEMLMLIITLFGQRFGLNSKNSSKPPASDPNRNKNKNKNNKGKNKPDGQRGHVGTQLEPVKDPDKIVSIEIDKRSLPRGRHYSDVGFECRQVVNLEISRVITEYRAQILEDETGKRFVANFPEGLSRPIQYGQSTKAHSVYLSQYQLIPYERVADYFVHEASIPISVGSLFNFNKEAYHLLEAFDGLAKEKLIAGNVMNADETGINVNGKRLWLHTACNEQWTYFFPHEKRGSEAMNEIDILPKFKGTLVHDHWKPYYIYLCLHSLCNAHHLRELQWVIDNHPQYTWAKELQTLLSTINDAVNLTEKNFLDDKAAAHYEEQYRRIIKIGEKQMPLMLLDPQVKKKRGREKKTKERNLLERLRDFEADTLRFMRDSEVPFSNNAGENDLRMTKVQQKISGCFRSIEGAKIFCRVRSYLLTAQKHGITATDALKILFSGKLPEVFFKN